MRLVEKLGRRYQEMTEVEKRIYGLMTQNVKEFALKPIGAVAEELEISKTSLMRFARSNGFRGYADFKKALQEEELLGISPALKLKKIVESGGALSAEKIQAQEVENIERTFANLNHAHLDEVVGKIAATESMHAMGWGMSAFLADMFTLRINLMGLKCETIQRKTVTLLEAVGNLDASELLVVFEMWPYVHEIFDAVSLAKAKGIGIVAVTDKPQCPLNEFADYLFCCSTDTEFFGNSLIGPLFWVNLLSSEVMYRIKDRVIGTLEKQQEIFKNPRYYII